MFPNERIQNGVQFFISKRSELKILYLTWDGPQTTYLESLFLPIFRRLQDQGIRFSVRQYSWGDRGRCLEREAACQTIGVPYKGVTVRRQPSGAGPLLTALADAPRVASLMKSGYADLVLARSTMPALIALAASQLSSFPIVFDADGLPLDERVEFGGSNPKGLEQKLLRRVEAMAVRHSRSVIVRTEAAREILFERQGGQVSPGKFHIVSNGRDPVVFIPSPPLIREQTRKELGFGSDTPVLVYAGSIGPQYRLNDMLLLLQQVMLKRPDARLLILTGDTQRAQDSIIQFSSHLAMSCDVRSASFDQIPRYLSAGDAGISFRTPSLSMRAVAPIKIGEYLLCGLPVVGTPGIGDIDAAVAADVFFPVEIDSPTAIQSAAGWVLRGLADTRRRQAARQIGIDRFSLSASASSYFDALFYR